MTWYLKFWGLLALLFEPSHQIILAQEKSHLTPEAITDKFIEKIGGEKWRYLKSRKDYAYVTYEEDKNLVIPKNSHDRVKVDLSPGLSIEVHKISNDLKSIFVLKPECIWYYSNTSLAVKFFGPELIKFKNAFPRTELMEILNLEPMKKTYVEDTLYRVDFKDIRQLDGKQSLFFGINSGLLYKRRYTNKNGITWEYHFTNYKESEGFFEPYLVKLTSNGKDYFSIAVKSILYNVKIDPNVFDPPISCKNENDLIHLIAPYTLVLD